MNNYLGNPEMRLPQGKIYLINSRPSGLSGTKVEKLSHSERRKWFSIKTISDITPNGAIKRWIVISSGKRSTLLRYFFLKFLYDELTKEEYKIFLSFNETTAVLPIYYALRARIIGVPKKIIRKIIETINFPLFKIPTREEYNSLKSIQFSQKEILYPPIKKPKPYSGYSKGFKDGKTRTKLPKDDRESSPLEPGPKFEDEINILINFSLEVMSHPRRYFGMLNNERKMNE